MCKHPDPTQEIVRQLYELDKSKSWFGKTNRDEAMCSLLSQMADAADYRTVACNAHLLFSSTSSVRQSARKTITATMAQVSPLGLLHISDALGWSYGWYVNDPWTKLAPSDVLRLATDEGSEAINSAVLGLASFHRNGFIRHEAVRLLATIKDGTELPFLLIRQNDWVRQVATDAQDAVEQRVREDYLPHLVRSLRLILHLASYSRYDHSKIVRRTVGVLVQQNYDESLKAAVESLDREVRRQVVRIGMELEGDHQVRLLRHALKSEDPIVRLCGCRHLTQVTDFEMLIDLLGLLRNDSSMPVRREALRFHTERFPSQARETWRTALLDRSSSIRELARFHLGKLDKFDATRFYRQAVSEQPDSLAALEGLAETADTSDIPFLRTLLTHKFPTRRYTAVRGLAHVGGESVVLDFVHSLRDDNPRVAREARKSLQSHREIIQGEALLAVALEASHPYARRAAANMISDLGKWPSLPWLIKAASVGDADTAGVAEQLIVDWFSPPKCNRVFTRPTSDERNAIREALVNSKGRLSETVSVILDRELHL